MQRVNGYVVGLNHKGGAGLGVAAVPDWTDALCAQVGTDLWFSPDFADKRQAVRICRACPLRDMCEATARANRETWGIWGGIDFGLPRRLRNRKAVHHYKHTRKARA